MSAIVRRIRRHRPPARRCNHEPGCWYCLPVPTRSPALPTIRQES